MGVQVLSTLAALNELRIASKRTTKEGQDETLKRLRMQHTHAQTTKAMLCTAVAIVVFLLASPRNAQAQTVTTIYTFVGGSNSSVNPYGAIAQGRDGEYYGMTVRSDLQGLGLGNLQHSLHVVGHRWPDVQRPGAGK
jgi:hypothetical protein